MSLQFLKPIEALARRRGATSTIFADFVRLAACCLAPRILHEDGSSVSIREKDYLETIARYDKSEVELLTEAFGQFILEADKHPHRDILGTAWLDYSSKYSKQARGEFYTPHEIAVLMAKISVDAEGIIKKGLPFTIQEPACGAGCMILALAEMFAPDHWHLPRFTAIDINPVACDMTFINTSLWSVPCEVICGNGLFPKDSDVRYPNIHWMRVKEDQRRALHNLLNPPTPQPEPEPPTPPESKDGWIQGDLFAA